MSRIEKANIPRPYNVIKNEREYNTKFSVDEMFEFLEGNNPEDASKVLDTYRFLERDLILKNKPEIYDNLSKKDIRKHTFLKVQRLAMYLEKIVTEQLEAGVPREKVDLTDYYRLISQFAVYDPQTCTRLGVHSGLFYNAIKGNGTKEQFNYWAFETGGLFAKNIYGCFGMTEMAHGSNVAGLETTSEYDYKTKTFTLNTPHLGATKWWIGGAASSANHCVVYARLIVKGKDYGVKTFVVPIRDANHHLMPGVSIGDIGAKMGRDGIDNGWIQFSNVKVPKFNLLQKYVKIDDEEEEVIDSPMNQLAYGALLDGRATMVLDSYRVGSKAVTIALRYAVGRRQFGDAENIKTNFASEKSIDKSLKIEKQLIDYPSHQYRLIPLLATVFCISSGSNKLSKRLIAVKEALQEDRVLTDQKFLFKTINELKEVFVLSASAKATSTWFTAYIIDQCRQACGGHGYSAYSSFGKTYNDWVVQCTWEGDNTVLSISAGRSIVKYRKAINEGKSAPNSFKYLANKHSLKEINFTNPKDLLKLFDLVIINAVDNVLDVLPTYDNNFEKVSIELVTISKFNTWRYYLETVLEYVENANGETIKPVMAKIINLYALYQVKENATSFLKYQLLSNESLNEIDAIVFKDLLPYLRHQIIALTDSFKLSDLFVNSVLGNFDGDIYNKYFDFVNSINNNSPDYDDSDYQQVIIDTLKRKSYKERHTFTSNDDASRKN